MAGRSVKGGVDPSVKIGREQAANYDPAIDVVFACTGNICRSPMAEALLRAHLAERAPHVTVGSAGLRFDGRPAERHAVKAMARRGIDLTGFRSRILSAELLEGASLILGMERLHVREVAVLGEDLFAKAFTLPELVEDAELFPPRGDVELADWLLPMARHRTPAQYLGVDPTSEVADPMGGSARTFRACADELDALIARLVDRAWPLPVAAGPTLEPPLPGGIHAHRDRR